jgi:hypothetical protein
MEHDTFLSIRNNLNWTRILILALISWFCGLYILYLDAWTVDWVEILSVVIGIFTLLIGAAVKLGKIEQKIEDQGSAIVRLEGWVQQLVTKERRH